MAKRRSKKSTEHDCDFKRIASMDALNESRRYAFGVETLCELVTDLIASGTIHDDAAAFDTSSVFVRLYWGISYTAAHQPTPGGISRLRPIQGKVLLWMCLQRIVELARDLAERQPLSQWQHIHETVSAWRDSWGHDERARMAQARFSTLTGLTRTQQNQVDYMNSALVEALSTVQA